MAFRYPASATVVPLGPTGVGASDVLVILPADRLVPGLEQAMDFLGGMAAGHANPFLVTGPSRTSDIEMQMVIGVHGPRAVHVLLVDAARA